jgi:hypothetical protein
MVVVKPVFDARRKWNLEQDNLATTLGIPTIGLGFVRGQSIIDKGREEGRIVSDNEWCRFSVEVDEGRGLV